MVFSNAFCQSRPRHVTAPSTSPCMIDKALPTTPMTLGCGGLVLPPRQAASARGPDLEHWSTKIARGTHTCSVTLQSELARNLVLNSFVEWCGTPFAATPSFATNDACWVFADVSSGTRCASRSSVQHQHSHPRTALATLSWKLTERGSSASQMTAATVMDIISRLPGCSGQAAGAVSACRQVKMEDASTSLKIPKSECLDIWTCLPKHKWPKIAVQYGRPSRSS